MYKSTILILFITTLFACNETQKNTSEKINQDADFSIFTENFVDQLWQTFPNWASYEGYHKYDSALTVDDSNNFNKIGAFLDTQESKLKAFDIKQLSDLNKIDYYLIRDFFQSQRFYRNTLKSNEWNPASYNLGGQFFNVIDYKDHSLEKRLKDISQKLNQLKRYYEVAKMNLNNPTEVHTILAIKQLKGSVQIFDQTLRDSLKASNLSENEKAKLSKKLDSAVVYINDFAKYLDEEIVPKIKSGEIGRDFRLGQELYEKKFKNDLSSAYSAREIYQKAIERKNDLYEKMFERTKKMWPKYFANTKMPEFREESIKMMIDTLSAVHTHRDSFITTIRQQIPELVAFVNEKDLITQDPTKPLVVRPTPEYMRGFAGASISAPGPYDANSETFYNVTPLDHYSPEEAESYLREYNQYLLQILNIHEAIPGHYTQLVYSNKAPSIIKSIFGNGAMVEGWAVYTELMMLENGYGNNSDELWLMYYKWNLRTVCNTILDYSIHVLDMNKDEAIHLLTNEAFQQEAEAEGKWKRAQLSSVQLCSYFTGFYEITELREEMKRKKGDEFNLKSFHERFLSYGSAPVKYIKLLMMSDNEQ